MSLNIAKTGLIAIVLCGIGGMCIFSGVKDMVLSKKEPIAFASLTADAMKKDTVIEGDIDFLVYCMAEKTESKEGQPASAAKVTRRWYIAPLENGHVAIVEGHSEMMASLDNLMEACWDIMDGKSETAPTPVHFKGVVRPLDEKVAPYLEDYISEVCEGDATEMANLKASFLPNVVMYKDLNGGMGMAIGGGVMLLIGLGVFFFIVRSAVVPRGQDYSA